MKKNSKIPKAVKPSLELERLMIMMMMMMMIMMLGRSEFAKRIAKINFATGSLRLSALPSLNQDRANDDKYRNYASSNEPLNLRAKNHLSLDHLPSNRRYDQNVYVTRRKYFASISIRETGKPIAKPCLYSNLS